MDLLHRLARLIVGLVALALLCLPAVVAFSQDWLALGQGDGTSIERWTLFALFFLGWTAALVVALVWCNERLGVRWFAPERARRLRRRERRRTAAGLRLLEGQEEARRPAVRRHTKRSI